MAKLTSRLCAEASYVLVHLQARQLASGVLVAVVYAVVTLAGIDQTVRLPLSDEVIVALFPLAPIVASGWAALLNRPRRWALERPGSRERRIRAEVWVLVALVVVLVGLAVTAAGTLDDGLVCVRNAALYLGCCLLLCRLIAPELALLATTGSMVLVGVVGRTPDGDPMGWVITLQPGQSLWAAAVATLVIMVALVCDVCARGSGSHADHAG